VEQFFGVHHLLDGFLLGDLGEPLVAPVFQHLGVEKVLVDGGQFGGQNFLQVLDNSFVALHGCISWEIAQTTP
jgi:hypothetical protein